MKIQEIINDILTMMELLQVNNQDNDHNITQFTDYVVEKLLRILHEKIGNNIEKELSAEDCRAIQALQREIFNVVKQTDAVPCHAPHSRLTALSLKLAQILEPLLNIHRYRLLLPSVTIIDYVGATVNLREIASDEDKDLQLTQFVLTDDGTAIIPVFECLAIAEADSFRVMHITDPSRPGMEMSRQLTETEQQRVINHSVESRAYWNAVQAKRNTINTAQTPPNSFYFERLIAALRAGGEHGQQGGSGLNAGEAANAGIVEFFSWFEGLPEQEQIRLRAINEGRGRFASFEYCFNRLGRGRRLYTPQEVMGLNNGYDTCVEITSGDLSAILNAQRNVINNLIDNRLEEADRRFINARRILETAMSRVDHQVIASYGHEARIGLEQRIQAALSGRGNEEREEREESEDKEEHEHKEVSELTAVEAQMLARVRQRIAESVEQVLHNEARDESYHDFERILRDKVRRLNTHDDHILGIIRGSANGAEIEAYLDSYFQFEVNRTRDEAVEAVIARAHLDVPTVSMHMPSVSSSSSSSSSLSDEERQAHVARQQAEEAAEMNRIMREIAEQDRASWSSVSSSSSSSSSLSEAIAARAQPRPPVVVAQPRPPVVVAQPRPPVAAVPVAAVPVAAVPVAAVPVAAVPVAAQQLETARLAAIAAERVRRLALRGRTRLG